MDAIAVLKRRPRGSRTALRQFEKLTERAAQVEAEDRHEIIRELAIHAAVERALLPGREEPRR